MKALAIELRNACVTISKVCPTCLKPFPEYQHAIVIFIRTDNEVVNPLWNAELKLAEILTGTTSNGYVYWGSIIYLHIFLCWAPVALVFYSFPCTLSVD